MNNRIRILILLFIGLFILSSISLPINNILAEEDHSDDSDIETTIHSRLETNSDEIIGSNESMGLGSYTFYQQPELDIGTFNYDLTQVEVKNLTYSGGGINNEITGSDSIPISEFKNYTTNSIANYTISGGFDTTISANINYNFTNFGTRTINIVTNGDSTPLEWTPTPSGTHYTTIDEGSSPNTADYIYLASSAYKSDTFLMQNISLKEDEIVVKIEFYVYHYGRMLVELMVDYDEPYFVYPYTYFNMPEITGDYAWSQFNWNDLSLNQEEINDLRIGFKSGTGSYWKYIASIYAKVYLQNCSKQSTPFKAVQINNFEYGVLGTNYTQTFNLSCATGNYVPYKETDVYCSYYFSSSVLTDYDHINDLTIWNQSIILTFYFWFSCASFQYAVNVSCSSINEWKVPTEVDLKINNVDVIDESYNSGYCYLPTYLSTLSITSSSTNIYFKLNISVSFSFSFSLEIISKTYLRKAFELESNHLIYFDRIDLDEDLNIKKIYLNNIDEGDDNPCYLTPAISMDTGNIYNLEIILADELYRHLPYDDSRELYDEDWSGWDLDYDENDTISSFDDGNLSSQLQEGHYPATYSFTNDADGSNPAGWSIIETGGSTNVYPNQNGHRKVVEMNDTSGSGTAGMENIFTVQISGTIEFYALMSVNNAYGYLFIKKNEAIAVYLYFMNGGNIGCYDGATYHNLQSYTANTWYHFKVVFNCNTDKFSVYINNILKASDYTFYAPLVEVNKMTFSIGTPSSSYKLYVDAIGYSWDNYAVGDNLFYENYMGTHDFEQYNQSTNADYRGIYNFDYKTEQGYYYMGQNDFNDQEVGDTGLDINWLTSYSGTGGDAKISSELNGHKNILNITDISDPNSVSVVHNFASLRTNVVIEFWVAKKSIASSTSIWFYLWQSGNPKIEVRWQENDFQYNNGTTWLDVELNCMVANTFNHFKFVCDDTNDLFDVYINGTLEGDNLKYKNTATGMDSCSFNTGSTFNGYSNYIDAIGCPTDDTSYIVGYNLPSYDIKPFLNEGFSLTCYLNSYFRANPSILGHTNILEIRHKNTGSQIIQKSFTGQNAGTIEFWWATSDATRQSDIQLIGNSGTRVALVLSIQSDKLQYYLGGWIDVPSMPISDSVWYHIRVDFDGTSDTWDLYVDGTNKLTDIAYRTDTGVVGNIDLFKMSCYASSVYNYASYFNAIHFSWTSGYVQYSNTNPYHEDLVNTNFDDDYSLTYAPYTYIAINGSYDAHKKQLILYDNSATQIAQLIYTFSTPQISGIIEFYSKITTTTQNTRLFYIQSSGNSFVLVRFESTGYITAYDSTSKENLITYSANTWYHFKIEFNCDTDKFSVYIDGILEAEDFDFYISVNSATNIFITTMDTSTAYYVYYDSISFSWEDNIGLNLLKEIPEIDNPYATINKTISYTNPELYAYTITFSFDYKFSNYGAYYNTTLFNSTDLIDDNSWHTYTDTFTTQYIFDFEFNISNGILLLEDLTFTINNQNSIQKTINPSTEINSVEFEEYLQADRNFAYWYYYNSLDINDMELENIDTSTTISTFEEENSKYYFTDSASINNEYTGLIDYQPDWDIETSYTINNRTQVRVKVEFKADLTIYNVSLVLDLRNSNIFLDSENPDRIEYIITLENINFTTSTQTLYINGYRTQYTSEPRSNLNTTQLSETFIYNAQIFSSLVSVNPNWFIDYDVIENNGTYTKLKVYDTANFNLINVDVILDLLADGIYNENWTLDATQSLITFKLTIPDVNFTTILNFFYIEGNSSVPYADFGSFINEDGFTLSDEEWELKVSDKEFRIIKKANWEDCDEYIYGYLTIPKYSKAFILNLSSDWEVDGIHYGNNFYDITSTGYFDCEGAGTGISTMYLRFATNPISDLKREQTRGKVVYTIDSEFDLEDVDFIFYIEEDEFYNKQNLIKNLKKNIDCDGIIEYYKAPNSDRVYYRILNMELDEDTNEIIILYEIETPSDFASLVGIILGISLLGIGITYVSIRYKDDNILDFMKLDWIVEHLLIWIKKSERLRMMKKNRVKPELLRKKKQKGGMK